MFCNEPTNVSLAGGKLQVLTGVLWYEKLSR